MGTINSRVYYFLSLFARAKCDAIYLQWLVQETARFESERPHWDIVADQAEALGITPLLYMHLKKAGVLLPLTAKRNLLGLYLRHRHANQVKTRVLNEILTAFDTAGIPALVLKGGALSHLVYPEPGLRPMGDLDILVPKSEVWRAQGLLANYGFNVPMTHFYPNEDLRQCHLPQAILFTDGISVNVEIHHNLFETYESHSMEIDELSGAPLSFSLGPGRITAHTLGYEDMLSHLCLHFCKIRHQSLLAGYCRLIWVADIISFAERFVKEIDWEKLEARCPFVLSTLSLLHFITPLAEALLARPLIKIEPKPKGIEKGFRGWPSLALGDERIKEFGFGRFLLDTFFPSEWWLRLYYGLGTTRPVLWYRLVRHPLHILRHIMLTMRNLMGRSKPG
jgi:hypothetical protein